MPAFEQQYFADNYRDYAAQNPAWKLAFYARSIERYAPAARPLDLLDVGCGLGRFLGFLAARGGYRLHGTDLSRYAIDENRRAWPGVDFRYAGATERPYPDASFDVVTTLDVIEHVPDLAAVGEAVAGMLRPGGLYVFVVPVYDGLSGPLIRRLDRDPTHVHKRERDFWLAWAAERFEVLGWWGMLRHLLPGGLYLHLPTRLGRRHTPAVLVAASKPAPLAPGLGAI